MQFRLLIFGLIKMFKLSSIRKKKTSSKVVLVVLAALVALMGYYVVSSYFDYQDQTITKLDAIAKTLAIQINGDEHQSILKKYKERDEIKTNDQDSVYKKIQSQLAEVYVSNHLKSDISTLYLDSATKQFSYVVNSSDTPYFRDPYAEYHQSFFDNYTTGGTIGAYRDEFGTWLTAFSPIKNHKGEVVAILEVDEKYDDFLHVADKKLYMHIGISLLIFLVVAVILLRYVRGVLLREEDTKHELEESSKIISERNQDILNSINYAKKIQTAILPPLEVIHHNLPHSFVLYSPKDIVSGDFYFFYEIEEKKKFFIAACDCTGHGVPGALMSMIGTEQLHHIIQPDPSLSPAEVLNRLNNGVVNVLKQDGKYGETRDGMDVSLCKIDVESGVIEFAGANRPLYILRNAEIKEVKGDKRPIGGYEHTSLSYTNHTFKIEKEDRFYMFSDGYADQFGGTNNKKFLVKKLQQLFIENAASDFLSQYKQLLAAHKTWKGNNEQTDDVLVIGFKVL